MFCVITWMWQLHLETVTSEDIRPLSWTQQQRQSPLLSWKQEAQEFATCDRKCGAVFYDFFVLSRIPVYPGTPYFQYNCLGYMNPMPSLMASLRQLEPNTLNLGITQGKDLAWTNPPWSNGLGSSIRYHLTLLHPGQLGWNFCCEICGQVSGAKFWLPGMHGPCRGMLLDSCCHIKLKPKSELLPFIITIPLNPPPKYTLDSETNFTENKSKNWVTKPYFGARFVLVSKLFSEGFNGWKMPKIGLEWHQKSFWTIKNTNLTRPVPMQNPVLHMPHWRCWLWCPDEQGIQEACRMSWDSQNNISIWIQGRRTYWTPHLAPFRLCWFMRQGFSSPERGDSLT